MNILKKVGMALTSQKKIIAMIHEEFDTATSRALSEAEEIIANDKTAKAEKLKKIGFVNSKSVEEARVIKEEVERKKRIASSVENCLVHYPNYKFITEDSVKTICKKYGLVMGEIEYFIGEVPSKNIEEMAAFKLRDEDKLEAECTYHEFMDGSGQGKSTYGYIISKGGGRYFEIVKDESKKSVLVDRPKYICAPATDFKKGKFDIKKGYLFVPKDPIVLQEVKEGYLIITKWGLESSDESLVNEINN